MFLSNLSPFMYGTQKEIEINIINCGSCKSPSFIQCFPVRLPLYTFIFPVELVNGSLLPLKPSTLPFYTLTTPRSTDSVEEEGVTDRGTLYGLVDKYRGEGFGCEIGV